jgi:phosphonate transport system substrate-binding protein
MIKTFYGFLWVTLSSCFIGLVHAEDSILIGIAPHSSARVILESHASLRSFLEARFGKSVEVVTAPNFSEFARRSLQGQYDLLITSPHLALMAQEKAQYNPLITYTQGLETVLVSRTETIPEKRPLVVFGLDPVSFVTLTGIEALKNMGLSHNTGMHIEYTSASDSTALAVVQGKADLAIMSLPNFNKLNDTVKNQLAIAWCSEPKPSRVYLSKVGKGISATMWQEAIYAFTTSPEGLAHLESNKLKGFRHIDTEELASVRSQADAALRYLATPSNQLRQ